jgi:hypothetical protein
MITDLLIDRKGFLSAGRQNFFILSTFFYTSSKNILVAFLRFLCYNEHDAIFCLYNVAAYFSAKMCS